VPSQLPRQLFELIEIADRPVSRIDAAIQVGAQPDMLWAACRARQVNGMPNHVV